MMADTDNESRDFCWIDGADKIIVPDQAAIACYLNGYGDIVLRRRSDYPDDDGWIWFQAEHAVAIAAAILDAAGLGVTDMTVTAERPLRWNRDDRDVTPEDRDVTPAVTDADRNGEAA